MQKRHCEIVQQLKRFLRKCNMCAKNCVCLKNMQQLAKTHRKTTKQTCLLNNAKIVQNLKTTAIWNKITYARLSADMLSISSRLHCRKPVVQHMPAGARHYILISISDMCISPCRRKRLHSSECISPRQCQIKCICPSLSMFSTKLSSVHANAGIVIVYLQSVLEKRRSGKQNSSESNIRKIGVPFVLGL